MNRLRIRILNRLLNLSRLLYLSWLLNFIILIDNWHKLFLNIILLWVLRFELCINILNRMIKLSILLLLFYNLFIAQKSFLCHILNLLWVKNFCIDQLFLRNILLIKLQLIIRKRLLVLIHLNHLLIRILHPLLRHWHLLRNLLRNNLWIELLLCKRLIFIWRETHKTNW